MSEFKKKSTIKSPFVAPVKKVLRKYHLHSVCESAHCPNIGECFKKKTATFLILGNKCTRNCRFCNIEHNEKLLPPDPDEPENLAKAVSELGLSYVVITTVTRDDLPDGGAQHFADIIEAIRQTSENTDIEVLTSDLQGDTDALNIIAKASPDVFNHNLETVERLYDKVRPQADYHRSLDVLLYMKKKGFITKSGIMTGVGETVEEIKELMRDLRDAGCDIMTIGQYFQPTKDHLEVEKDYSEDEFKELRNYGLEIGFSEVYAGRFVRSSFNAKEVHDIVKGREI